jgi:hypothetical protein
MAGRIALSKKFRFRKLEGGAEVPIVRTPRYSPPMHMLRFTTERQTTPHLWVHPDEER